ncbi:hypothetical protein [Thiomicrorhabdus sp. 6S3-12]|uniref:hypothetical protein n=1 Tax=Thiomicrorhabdus sp. 6S3-12 TaxID=2819681 RepID=UPI001AAD51B6|nr:hypothetical protein [Thiomicrorhabdus sp. 6S3-12]MBO1923163.1 hypothetical protein [Thiomicrorhabdus sp. 6S3-12]
MKVSRFAVVKTVFSLFLGLVVISDTVAQESVSKQLGDYHLTLYPDIQGDVLDLEAFTKQSDNDVFFGVTCSAMSPFPSMQILLFEDEIISEFPRLMDASYQIDGKPGEVPLQAILKADLTADRFVNRLRFEVDTTKVQKRMDLMKQAYHRLLDELEQGKTIQLTVEHRHTGKKSYRFSLQGLKTVLQPYQRVCR